MRVLSYSLILMIYSLTALSANVDYDHEIAQAQEVLANKPDDVRARFDLAWAQAGKGDYPAAEAGFKRLSKLGQNKLGRDSVYNLGVVRFAQDDLQGALEAWRQGLRGDPTDQDMLHNYVFVRKLLQAQEQEQKQESDESEQEQENEPQPGDQAENNQRSQFKGELSPEEAIRLLNALQEQEQKTKPESRQVMRGLRREKDW